MIHKRMHRARRSQREWSKSKHSQRGNIVHEYRSKQWMRICMNYRNALKSMFERKRPLSVNKHDHERVKQNKIKTRSVNELGSCKRDRARGGTREKCCSVNAAARGAIGVTQGDLTAAAHERPEDTRVSQPFKCIYDSLFLIHLKYLGCYRNNIY